MAVKTKKAPPKDPNAPLKYRSGFCLNGFCEGTKPVSSSGVPMRTCDWWQRCPCKCHALITEMCDMAGIERMLPEQSAEYLAHMREARAGLVPPSDLPTDPVAGLSMPDGTGAPVDTSDAVATPIRDAEDRVSTLEYLAPGPVFRATPSGRRARGQLEEDVREVCQEFAQGVYDWEHCTPKLVAERIAKKYAIEPPSTGAINAVWDRWEKIGFAEQAKKPSRFIKFKIDGSTGTLAACKSKVKRDKKQTVRELRHGIRR